MRAVGYVRVNGNGYEKAEAVQRAVIQAFCTKNDYELLSVFCDTKCARKESASNAFCDSQLEMESCIPKRKCGYLSEFEEMLCIVEDEEVDVILVDTVIRLYSGRNSEDRIIEFCKEHRVTVLEVGEAGYLDTSRIGVYYKTNYKGCRSVVPLKEIDKLYIFINQLFGDGVLPRLFLERTYNSNARYEAMLRSNPETIISKSFFRLYRRSMVLLNNRADYRDVRFLCSEDGELVRINAAEILAKPLKVAIYERARSIYEENNQDITLEKLKTYSLLRTKWSIEDIYIDETNSEIQLKELENNLNKYDLVLSDTVAKIGEYTEVFVRMFKGKETMFFSLQEGGYEIDSIYTPEEPD